ncbi:MAG: c-type cytochrome [Terriglobia bacterium]
MIGVVFLSTCAAKRKPLPLERTVANMAKDVVIPIESHNAKDPFPPSTEAIKAGEQVYLQDCALCHGSDGHGYTNLGRHMFPPAMDLTSPHVQHWTNGDLFWIIQNGIGLTGMPSWSSSISATDSWNIAQFIHGLPRLDAEQASAASAKAAPAVSSEQELVAYGRTLYRQEGCFMCHRLDGQGGKVGPNLTYEGTRGRTDAWLIGHFKDPSAYSSGSIMPAFKNLTDEQLQALTTFLQSQKGSKK